VPRSIPVLAFLALALPAAGGGGVQQTGLIVFASTRTSALIPQEVRSIDLRTGRSRRVGIVRLSDVRQTAWSPGGRALAWTDDEGDVYVARPGGRRVRIVRGRADPERALVWSPSGRLVAFLGPPRPRRVLFVVRAAGGGLRRIAYRAIDRVAWSPDEHLLALTGRHRLAVVQLRSRGMLRILPTGRGRPEDLAWSPDGRRIAFRAQVPGERATIRTIDLATGTVRRVLRGGGMPFWSPDGRKLAVDDKHRLRVVGVGLVATHPGVRTEPVWSPDSDRLVFWSGRDLVVVSAQSRRTRRLTRELKRYWLTVEPTWSRSGRIVYVGYRRDPQDFDLHVVRPDGSGVRALTTNAVGEREPAWAPDGRRIAYTRSRGRLNSDVYVMNADGSGQRRVVGDGASPSWSPGGARLAFERGGDIWTAGLDGAEPVRITNGPERDSQPDWSPLGDEISFARDPVVGTSEIYVIHVATSAVRRITTESTRNVGCYGNSAWAPAWSPDGSWIAYEVERGGSSVCAGSRGHDVFVHVVQADGSGRRFVTDGGYRDSIEDDGALTPTWSPDGSEIAFVSSLARGDAPPGGRLGIVAASGGTFRLMTPSSYSVYAPDWRP
jgi:TolB protein